MNIHFDFASILAAATLASGLIVLVDRLFWRKNRLVAGIAVKEPILTEYARSFFPVLLIVFVLRSFLIEPFRIPSGSMEPTLNTGDFILVNKFTYGLRIPVINKLVYENNLPARGDSIVFRFPVNMRMDFIKRVIGVPGDMIEYKNKELYINGEKIKKTFVADITYLDSFGQSTDVQESIEDLLGIEHEIYERAVNNKDFIFKVPAGKYFVMGDNRDDSDDSRSWGFVPVENVVGKAFMVWLSWDSNEQNWLEKVRWSRIGKIVN